MSISIIPSTIDPDTAASEVTHWTIPRSGAPPLHFRGRLLFVGCTQPTPTRDSLPGRWHELALWQCEPAGYACALWYCSSWKGEPSHREAHYRLTAPMLVEAIRQYEPLAHLLGYPPGAQFEEKQRRLRLALAGRWAQLVSDALASDPAFSEPVEGPAALPEATQRDGLPNHPPNASNAPGGTEGAP